MIDRLLTKAKRLFVRRQFSALIELLEPEIFHYREEEVFYRLLGLACFYQNDWKGVDTYLQRYKQLTSTEEPDILLALALAAIKRKDFQEAAQLFLEILDDHPSNRRARRGLLALRKALARENTSIDLRTKIWTRIFPPSRGLSPTIVKSLWVSVIIMISIGLISTAIFWWRNVSDEEVLSPLLVQHRPGPGQDSIEGMLTQSDGLWKLTLTDKEIKQSYQKIQKFFQEYRDSLARLEINRLLLSNAASSIKEKARAFLPFLNDPEFVNFQDNIVYDEVKVFPELYEGCAVKWRGVIANLKNEEYHVTFDLLLGYEQGQIVEAVLPVQLFFPVLLQNSRAVELLAVIEKGTPIRLRGIVVRDLGYRS